MISVYARHSQSPATLADRIEPEWLLPASGVTFWVDLSGPTAEEHRVLADVFHFHPLSVEDAMSAMQFPKIESYPGYLYLVLHGIDVEAGQHAFATRDVDFFLGPNYLVTIHDGRSRSISRVREMCNQYDRVLADGPGALLHRIIDVMVDNYARREFPAVSDELAYRFRDVYDHVVRSSEEAILFQDRVTGILEVNLSTVSNRLNKVVQVLTVMSTIFLPLTVLTSMWGMNIALPRLPGGPNVQFVWIVLIMAAISATMLAVFRHKRWI